MPDVHKPAPQNNSQLGASRFSFLLLLAFTAAIIYLVAVFVPAYMGNQRMEGAATEIVHRAATQNLSEKDAEAQLHEKAREFNRKTHSHTGNPSVGDERRPWATSCRPLSSSDRLGADPRHTRTASGAEPRPTTKASEGVTLTPLRRASVAKVSLRQGSGSFSQRWYPLGCAS